MSTQVKKVLKKKVVNSSTPVVEATQPVDVPVEAVPADTVDILTESFIPSSRIHNYISCVKLNKEYDELITNIKLNGFQSVSSSFTEDEVKSINDRVAAASSENDATNALLTRINAGEELSSVLSPDDQKKVGELISAVEQKNQKLPDGEKQGIDIKEISVSLLSKRLVTQEVGAVELVSKKRAKFSKESFDVLATFSDMVVQEISKFALDRLTEVGNSTVEPKYVFSSENKLGDLYGYYSNLPSYKKAEQAAKEAELLKEAQKKAKKSKKEDTDDTGGVADDVAEITDEGTDASDDDKKINFKFYIKSIVYKMKETNEKYSNAKVSDRFQTLCSDIVLDILDDAVDLSQIILNVMSTKTISTKLFKSCIYTKIYNLPSYESVKQKLDSKFA